MISNDLSTKLGGCYIGRKGDRIGSAALKGIRNSKEERSVGLKSKSLVLFVVLIALFVNLSSVSAKTQIDFWFSLSGQLGETVEELVKNFNDSQDEFEVVAFFRGAYAESMTAAIAAYRAGNAPHILQVYEVGTQTMLLSGAVYPVYQLMQDQGITMNWDDFLPAVLSYYTHEGNLYSMPFNSSSPIFFYNKDIFAAAGLDPEKPPTTWQEVEEYSRQIIASGAARYGFTTGWPSWVLLENMHIWHGEPFASLSNGFDGLDASLLINGEFGINHVTALAAWQEEGIFHYGGRGDAANWIFMNGEAAMMPHSSGLIGAMKKSDLNWGATQLPHWGEPYPKTNSIIGGATLWVLKGHDSAEYRGVAEFLEFISQPEQQAWWHKRTGYVPVSITASEILEAEGHFEREPYQQVAISQLNYSIPTANTKGIRLGNFVEIRNVLEEELENIFAGKKSVRTGLDDAVKRANDLLAEFAEIYK